MVFPCHAASGVLPTQLVAILIEQIPASIKHYKNSASDLVHCCPPEPGPKNREAQRTGTEEERRRATPIVLLSFSRPSSPA